MFRFLLTILVITAGAQGDIQDNIDCTNCPSANQIGWDAGAGEIEVTSVTGEGAFTANSATTYEDILNAEQALATQFTKTTGDGDKACFIINFNYPVAVNKLHVCGVSVKTKFVTEIKLTCGDTADTQTPAAFGYQDVVMGLPGAGVGPAFDSCSVCITDTTGGEFFVYGFDINACVICDYTDWSNYGQCLEGDCGLKNVERTRECECDDEPYECLDGDTSQTKNIDCGCCPIDCVMGEWSAWSGCNAGCGETGSRSRDRDIVTQNNECGEPCGVKVETESCNGDEPVDCVMGEWSAWSGCNAGCGETGSRSRDRDIVTQNNECGEPCGVKVETESCNGDEPVDCILGDWSDWSACSVTCGDGTQERQREVDVMNNECGAQCGNQEETRTCSEECACPENARVTLDYNNQGEIDEMKFVGKVNPADSVFSQDPLLALEGSGADVIMSKNDDGEDTLVVYFSPKVQVFEVSLEYKLNAQVKLDLYGAGDVLLFAGNMITSPSGPNYDDWHTAVWTPEFESENVKKAVISFGSWEPSNEVKVRNLKLVVCPPEREDCVCRVRGDPVVENCFGDLLFLDAASVGQQLAVGSADSDCPDVEIYINNVLEGQAIVPESVVIRISGTNYVMDASGNVAPALPAAPASTKSTMDGMTTITFDDCGLSVSFKKTENFSIININIPGELQLSNTGFCF